jgi:membrane protease YdiL (CAAX protease family)
MFNFTRRDGVVILLYVLLIAANLFVVDRLGLSETAASTVRLVVILLNAFIVIYAYRGLLGADWHAFGQRKWTKWAIIIATFLLVTGMITLLRRLSAGHTSDVVEEAAIDTVQRPGNLAFAISLVAMLVPLISAVTEEVMFRNVLMFKHSRNKTVLYIMWIVSSVAFGLIHFAARGSVAATVPYIFVGLIFGALYLWQKNIWYNIFAHMLFNGVNVVMALVGAIVQRLM